ncbi:uncharacterized protein MONBRDRAFT_26630 [Monosiga brevicollis MX1]|uniref:t-SNARE coiled-coil homology domain-containing protein n=1 Tax=Monosiga brevicollis TaxID=81824 RepID=A9V2X4_MONBE|nr:uncharacterized protein MONBRDRAFT_26630 [Monosiga brevicollis MX1]EDQ88090.1 predicted protein [Monosiga brevicollis MX1]|eukprot:XP_001747166.1 hypothetical protein [Monosiga brevicollis MX1]
MGGERENKDDEIERQNNGRSERRDERERRLEIELKAATEAEVGRGCERMVERWSDPRFFFNSRSKGIARDGDTEYIRLSETITTNIFSIQKKVRNIEKLTRVVGTRGDGRQTMSQLQDLVEDCKDIIRETTDMIKQFGRLDGGTASERKNRGLEQTKMRKDLEAVANQFKVAYKAVLQKEQATISRERAESVGYGQGPEEKQSLIEDDRRQQLDMEVDYRTAQIEERNQGIRELESQMTEVNDIFKDLAQIVQEQGDQLDSIEANLTTTASRTEQGVEELTRASRYQKSARGKALCLFVIVAVVAGIIAIIVVESLKKKKH